MLQTHQVKKASTILLQVRLIHLDSIEGSDVGEFLPEMYQFEAEIESVFAPR